MVLKLFTTFIVVAAILASPKLRDFTWSYRSSNLCHYVVIPLICQQHFQSRENEPCHVLCSSCLKVNLVPRARDPLGRGTKGSGIIHLLSPQIVEIPYYCACAKFFKMEDMRTEIHTIF